MFKQDLWLIPFHSNETVNTWDTCWVIYMLQSVKMTQHDTLHLDTVSKGVCTWLMVSSVFLLNYFRQLPVSHPLPYSEDFLLPKFKKALAPRSDFWDEWMTYVVVFTLAFSWEEAEVNPNINTGLVKNKHTLNTLIKAEKKTVFPIFLDSISHVLPKHH